MLGAALGFFNAIYRFFNQYQHGSFWVIRLPIDKMFCVNLVAVKLYVLRFCVLNFGNEPHSHIGHIERKTAFLRQLDRVDTIS
jgi:hypothetical protein